MFNFAKQKKLGQKGEKIFQFLFPELVKGDGDIVDFYWGEKTLELKSESYSTNETPNFFIEKYGNIERKTLGGPYKALKNNIDYYIHFFVPSGEYFVFYNKDLKELIKITEKGNYRVHKTPNAGWESYGKLVVRKDVAHLFRHKIIEDFGRKLEEFNDKNR